MISVNPQYIKDADGKKSLVILPAKEFEAILEELELNNAFAKEEIVDNLKKGFEEMQLIKQGKSGGARIISFVKIIDKTVYLLTIYNKEEKDSISDKEIEDLLEGYL